MDFFDFKNIKNILKYIINLGGCLFGYMMGVYNTL
jgi:hypothetical protein